MTISSSDLIFCRAVVNSSGDTNGGRLGSVEITDSAKNNVFPDVSEAERSAGKECLRKLGIWNCNADNEEYADAAVMVQAILSGDDSVCVLAADWRDVQADLDLSTARRYGSGTLSAAAAAGATSFDVQLEEAADWLVTGDTLWLYEDGTEEVHENVTVSRSGTVASVTLDDGDVLANAFTPAAVAGSVLALGDITPAFEDWTEDAGGDGTFDEDTYPPELDNNGSVDDDWTITFTDATSFSVSGLYSGTLASGSTATDYAPANADNGQPYFTLRTAGWAGSWAAGDTITFTTRPAKRPFWLLQTVPAGAASNSADTFTILVKGVS